MAATNRVLTVPASTSTTTPMRLFVGDAKAIHLPLRHADARKRGVDLAPAAVDDHQARALGDVGQHRGQRREPLGLLEQLAAELEQRDGLHSRPTRSSYPNATLKFCTA